MTIPVIQSIVRNNGKCVILPVWFAGEPDWAWGNLVAPNPHANSSTGDTQQQYPVGTEYIDGERAFFYGYMAGVTTATKANIFVFNNNKGNLVTLGATAGVKGDTVVGILASTLEDDTTPEEDYYAGGYFMPRTNPYSSYRVLHSTTYTGGRTSGEVDLTLDYGLIESVTASVASCYLDRNQYTAMYQDWAGGSIGSYAGSPGVTLIDPIASTYQWVQSWGPCYVVPYNDEIGGAGNRDCFIHIDGSIKVETRASGAMHQRAGRQINNATSSNVVTWLIEVQVDK